jgi:toxin-antitoxin system PIN domain toxin
VPDLYLPDLNVLFSAHMAGCEHHKTALDWLTTTSHFATCALTESGLIRLMMNPDVRPAGTFADGIAALTRLRASRRHSFWFDDTSLVSPLIDTTRILGYRQVPDDHLLNLAVTRGARLVTLDGKIARSCTKRDARHITTLL